MAQLVFTRVFQHIWFTFPIVQALALAFSGLGQFARFPSVRRLVFRSAVPSPLCFGQKFSSTIPELFIYSKSVRAPSMFYCRLCQLYFCLIVFHRFVPFTLMRSFSLMAGRVSLSSLQKYHRIRLSRRREKKKTLVVYQPEDLEGFGCVSTLERVWPCVDLRKTFGRTSIFKKKVCRPDKPQYWWCVDLKKSLVLCRPIVSKMIYYYYFFLTKRELYL